MRLSILLTFCLVCARTYGVETAASNGTAAAAPTKSDLDFFDPGLDAQMQKCLHPPPQPAAAKKPGEKGPPPPDRTRIEFTKVDDPKKLPNADVSGNLDDLKRALKIQLDSCQAMSAKKRKGRTAHFGCVAVNADEYCVDVNKKMLSTANQPGMTYPDFLTAIHSQFDWYQSQGRDADSTAEKTIKKGDTQMTGYYAPASIQLNEEPNGYYQYPVYRDPQKKDRHYTREQIDDGALLKKKTDDGKPVVIGYAHNPVDIAFLQVQGAGPADVNMRDGTTQHLYLNTGMSNGYKRSMLGSILKCDGQPRSVWGSMEGIRKFLEDPANRQMRRQLMNYDQTYLYFDDSHQVPLGADGLELTKRASLAVDPNVIPIGAAVLFNVKHPANTKQDCKPITAMGIAQDTGSAITDAHMDWYQGEGADASLSASAVNCPAQAFVPLIKGEGVQIPGCPSGKVRRDTTDTNPM
jgi:membrane-bound lytic murein transglycosylase